jgi:hypothetical protein
VSASRVSVLILNEISDPFIHLILFVNPTFVVNYREL